MKYEVSTLIKSWHDARVFCRNKGGDLASFSNIGEQSEAMSGISHSNLFFWIGLSDLEREGKWKWSDGSTSSWRRWMTYWGQSEPNGGRSQNCAFLYWPSGYWDSNSCYELLHFVCKVPGMKKVS